MNNRQSKTTSQACFHQTPQSASEEPQLSVPTIRKDQSSEQRSCTKPSEKSEKSTRKRFVTMVVAVNDRGQAIGEDNANAKYLDSDVEEVISLRQEGYSLYAISAMLDIPIRTIRDYISGRTRNKSVSGWRTIRREIR